MSTINIDGIEYVPKTEELDYTYVTKICEINCDAEDVPILYVNGKHPGQWHRVKCPDCKKLNLVM